MRVDRRSFANEIHLPDAHQISRLVTRQMICGQCDHAPELIFILSSTQSTDGIATAFALDDFYEGKDIRVSPAFSSAQLSSLLTFDTLFSELCVESTLNDGKDTLFIGTRVCRE